MPSSCDYPLELNPAYRNEVKPDCGFDDIEVPVYNEVGDIIEREKVCYTWEQYGDNMQVKIEPYFKALSDDVYAAIRDRHCNYSVEFV